MRQGLAVLFAFAAVPGFAFNGGEHTDLTNHGLRLALATSSTTGDMRAAAPSWQLTVGSRQERRTCSCHLPTANCQLPTAYFSLTYVPPNTTGQVDLPMPWRAINASLAWSQA